MTNSLPSLPETTLLVRHSSRPKHAPAYLQDYHCNLASSIPPPNSGTMYLIDKTLSYSHLSTTHKAYKLAISTLVEPSFYHEAVFSPNWCEAMDKEFAALEANHTWVLTALQSGKHPISCNGYIRSSLNLMEALRGIRLDWLQMGIVKWKVFTMQRPLLQWPSWSQLDVLLPLQLLKVGLSLNLM